MLRKFILHLHFTKSYKPDNIYKLCLLITEEHSCLIITPKSVSKPRYDTNAESGVTIFIHCIHEW